MSGTKRKTAETKSNMPSASKKRKPSSKTQRQSSRQTKTARKKSEQSSSATRGKVDSSSSSSSKKTTKKPSASSRRASSPAPTKNPWDGYDWNSVPTISSEQGRTFRRVTQEEHDRFKRARGRPKKEVSEKTQPITLRIEPSLLEWVQSAASRRGLPWQTYLKILVKKGLETTREKAASE